MAAHEAVADFFLAHLIGGGGDVDQKSGSALHQYGEGINIIQFLAPDLLLAPGVLTDGDAQVPAFEGHHADVRGRLKVPGFIKHVVGGQQGFVPAKDGLSLVKQDRGIVQPFTLGPAGGPGGPHDEAQMREAGRQGRHL